MRTDAPCEIRQSHFSILLALTGYCRTRTENSRRMTNEICLTRLSHFGGIPSANPFRIIKGIS